MNDINSISPNFRDFLLGKNLIFSNSVTSYYKETFGQGLGRMVEISNGDGTVQQGTGVVEPAKEKRKLLLSKGRFLPSPEMVREVNIENSNLDFNQIKGGYLVDGEINGVKNRKILNGAINLFSGGSYYSYGTQLASALVDIIADDDDTSLGKTANKQLIESFKLRTLSNAYKESIGKLNLDVVDLIKGGKFIKDDFRITRSSNFLGQLGDKALDVLGIQSSSASMSSEASIFSYETTTPFGEGGFVSTEERNNAMIKETGQGQQRAIYSNLNLTIDPKFNGGGNRYLPNLTFKRIKKEFTTGGYATLNIPKDTYEIEEFPMSTIIPYDSSHINQMAYNFDTAEGVNKPERSEEISTAERPYFSPMDRRYVGELDNKHTLLGKTQELFNKGKIETLIANKGKIVDYSETFTPQTQNNSSTNMISKGSQVMYIERSKGSFSSNPNEVFCRAWVASDRYDTVNRLQKHRGIDPKGGFRSGEISNSVLDDNGFVKIAPYKSDSTENDYETDVKQYMFSIENLAWAKDLDKLPYWEIGNGDPVTKTKGRLMWFPPYDLKFSENTGVNIDTHYFIGRGEPIYTYNSTERSGQLSFKVIIDHPQWINNNSLTNQFGMDANFDNIFNSINSGCGSLPDYIANGLTKNEINQIETDLTNLPETEDVSSVPEIPRFNIYFPNDVVTLGKFNDYIYSESVLDNLQEELDKYKNDTMITDDEFKSTYAYTFYETTGALFMPMPTQWGEIYGNGYTDGIHTDKNLPYKDRYNYVLNGFWKNAQFFKDVKELMKEYEYSIVITGYASEDGDAEANYDLALDRAENVERMFKSFLGIGMVGSVVKGYTHVRVDENITGGGTAETGEVDSLPKKMARYVSVEFIYTGDLEQEVEAVDESGEVSTRKVRTEIKGRFYNEADHFQKLAQEDKFTFNKIQERIKYFQPAFHSTTPEGFNSRLTFLNQCTRQGSTLGDVNRPDNMAFGAPPVCILRIGDFYNTKIMIDNMTIDYEQLWDLNPEGVGVQPMIADVTLTFKFIGGSSMQGAINKLQNALSFNYYANTGIFDPRANVITRNGENGEATYFKEVDEVHDRFYSSNEDDSEVVTQNNLNNNDNNKI